MEAMLASFTDRIQELEDAAWEVADYLLLKNAFGVVLDKIGKIVGRSRRGLEDDDYKIALRARIRINRSFGRPEDLIAVARLSLPSDFTFVYGEAYMAVLVLVNEQATFDIPTLFANLTETRAGGVRLLLTMTTIDPGQVFTFGSGERDELRGLGSVGSSVGGKLSFVLQG